MQLENSSLLDAKLAREAFNGPVATVVTDALGCISWCNKSAESLFSLPAQEILGKRFAELVNIKVVHVSDVHNICEVSVGLKPAQGVAHCQVQRPTGCAHYFFPLTTFVQELRQLRNDEAMMRFALEASGHAIWDFKAEQDGRPETNYYSENWRKLRGLSAEAASCENYELWMERIHPEDRARVAELVSQQDSGQIPEISYEYRERHTNGQYIWILARGKVFQYAESGLPLHIVGLDVDVTKLKDEEFRQAEQTLSIFRKHTHELEQAMQVANDARLAAEESAEKARTWYNALDTVGHGVWSYRVSHDCEVVELKPVLHSHHWLAMRGLSDFKSLEITLNAWKSCVHPEDFENAARVFSKQYQGELDEVSLEYRERHADGHWIWILCKGRTIEKDALGRATLVIGVSIDITKIKTDEEKRAREAQEIFQRHVAEVEDARKKADLSRLAAVANAKREEIWRRAVDASGFGVWSYNVVRKGLDATSVVDVCSDAWFTMRGAEVGDASLNDLDIWYDRVHPEDLDHVMSGIDKQINGSEDDVSFEYRERHKAGHWVWILVRGKTVERDKLGRPLRVVGLDMDISSIKAEARIRIKETELQHNLHISELKKATAVAERAQNEAQVLARTDTTTGLANRRMFREQIADLTSAQSCFAVLIIDLDRFKKVNVLHGHSVGDSVLRETAKRLAQTVGNSGILARLGSDEFALILTTAAHELSTNTQTSAQQIIEALSKSYEIASLTVQLGATVGSALSLASGDDYEKIMHRADMALQHAKSNARGVHIAYTDEMGKRAEDRVELENDLKVAIKALQIETWFQPILCAKSDRVEKLEVLARWQHPQRGFIPPDQFIAMAQYLGVLPTLSINLLRSACEKAVHWNNVKLSFNVSATEASDINTPLRILNTLQQTGFDPSRLEIEITEQAFLDDLAAARQVVDNLRRIGIKVYVDDFGEGYAGIGYLRDFEVDGIKFDRSCVTNICNKPAAFTFLKSIQLMATTMNLETVAEGIETQDVWDKVKALGCSFGQGYLFSKALPSSEIEPFLIKYSSTRPRLIA